MAFSFVDMGLEMACGVSSEEHWENRGDRGAGRGFLEWETVGLVWRGMQVAAREPRIHSRGQASDRQQVSGALWSSNLTQYFADAIGEQNSVWYQTALVCERE